MGDRRSPQSSEDNWYLSDNERQANIVTPLNAKEVQEHKCKLSPNDIATNTKAM